MRYSNGWNMVFTYSNNSRYIRIATVSCGLDGEKEKCIEKWFDLETKNRPFGRLWLRVDPTGVEPALRSCQDW